MLRPERGLVSRVLHSQKWMPGEGIRLGGSMIESDICARARRGSCKSSTALAKVDVRRECRARLAARDAKIL